VNEYLNKISMISRNARRFLIGGLFNGLGMAVFSLLFNLYLKEYGYGEGVIGQILSLGALGAAVIAVPAAILIERFHIKHILIITTLLASAAYALQIYFKEIGMIMAFSFLATMFITVYRVSVAPFFMRNSTEKERIYLFSISYAVMMFSQFAGFMAGGYLPNMLMRLGFSVSKISAYETSLYMSIIMTIVSVIPFSRIDQKPVPPVKTVLRERIKDIDWHIIFRLMIPKILVGMGAGLVIPFMNLYFKIVFGLESDTIGIYFSILQIFMFVGMLCAPFLTQRFGMIKSIVFTELASIPFMLLLAITTDIRIAVAAFVLRGTLMNMNIPISSNFEMELVEDRNRPLTNAVSMLSWNAAWTLSAHFGGGIIEKYSFTLSFFITVGLYFFSAATYYMFFKDKRH